MPHLRKKNVLNRWPHPPQRLGLKKDFFAKKKSFHSQKQAFKTKFRTYKKYKENPAGLNGAWKVFAVVLRKRRKGGRFNLHLFARSIRSRLFNVHIREAPGGERRCSNRFLSNSLSPPCPLKPMDALWKLFADVWWWSVSVMVYIHNGTHTFQLERVFNICTIIYSIFQP